MANTVKMGSSIKYYVGMETTAGSGTTNKWIRFHKSDANFNNRADYIEDKSSIGSIDFKKGEVKIREWGEGTLEGNIKLNEMTPFFKAIFGKHTPTSISNSSGGFQHKFQFQDTNIKPTIAIVRDDGYEKLIYKNCVVTNITISGAVNDYVKVSITVFGRKGIPISVDVSSAENSVDYILQGKHTAIRIANTLSDLSGSSGYDTYCVQSFSYSIASEQGDYKCIQDEPDDINIYNKGISLTGTIEIIQKGKKLRELNDNDGYKAFTIIIEDPNNTIGAKKGHITLAATRAKFKNLTTTETLDDIVKQTIQFEVHGEGANLGGFAILELNNKQSI